MSEADNKAATAVSGSILASRPSFVPAHAWVGHWLTIEEFARMMGRRPQTVYKWIRQNSMMDFNISTYEFRIGRKHSARIFVRNPY
jgi:hypothetical protein